MSKPYSGIPIDQRRTWVVPRWLKEAFVAFAVVCVSAVVASKLVQHFGGALARAKSEVAADEVDLQPPPLKLTRRDGSVVDLAALRGKPVLVHFWATWCAPCRDELPTVEKLVQRTDPGSLEVLAVSVDETWAPVEHFLPRNTPLTVLLDPAGKTSLAFGTSKFPESYLVDRDGRVRLKFVGSRNWTEPAMHALLAAYGAKPKS